MNEQTSVDFSHRTVKGTNTSRTERIDSGGTLFTGGPTVGLCLVEPV